MVSSFCLHKPPVWIMGVLALFLLCSSYLLGLGISSIILTSIALSLPTFFATKKQGSVVGEGGEEGGGGGEEEVIYSDEESSASTSILGRKGFQEHLDRRLDCSTPSPDFLAESECLDPPSHAEESEAEWPYRGDGSISDEESLIEITLSSGNQIRQKEEDSKLHFLHKNSPDSVFRQPHLVDFLAELNEMNEEENLIEIDLSVGSIKYSRFEIKA